MGYFKYDRSALCPTDHQVVEIYKDFTQLLEEGLNNWKIDIGMGLLMERSYSDIMTSRITIKPGRNGHFGVVELIPVLDDATEENIKKYGSFFKTYMQLKDNLIRDIKFNLSHPVNVRPSAAKIRAGVNVLKMSIHAFMHDKFDELDFRDAITDPLSELSASWIRSIGLPEIIGPKFEQGGTLDQDDPEELLHSFIRYVRKSMLRQRVETIGSLIGDPLER